MKWKIYKLGDTRIKEKFLWFPKECNNEGRWLERAKYEEVYSHTGYWTCDTEAVPVFGWRISKWLD